MALCVCCLLTGCYNANESRENVLKVYNWADYIGEGVLEDFQEYYKEVKAYWKIFRNIIRNRQEKTSASCIRRLTSTKSC